MAIITVFYIKLIICFFLTVGVYLLVRKKDLLVRWQQGQDKVYFLTGFFIFRVIPWIVVFVVANQEPRGDIPFFFGKAIHAKVGEMVYRDFWSYHAPLFPYIISIPLFIWHNAKAIVALMLLIETVILWFCYKVYKPKRTNALQLVALYWMLPATFAYMLIGGQEDVWFSGVALLMLYHIRKNPTDYEMGVGIIFAVAMITIKASFIIFLFPLLILVRNYMKILVVMSLIGGITVGILYFWIGDLFLMPIQHTSQLMSPNLFSVSRPFVELFYQVDENNSTLINWAGLFFSILLPSMIAWKVRKQSIEETIIPVFVACFASLIIFQPSSPGAYMIAFVLLLVFELIDTDKKSHIFMLMILNWMTVVQPFLFVYLGQVQYTSFSYFKAPSHLLEWLTQIINVICLVWVINLAYQKSLKAGRYPKMSV